MLGWPKEKKKQGKGKEKRVGKGGEDLWKKPGHVREGFVYLAWISHPYHT